MQDGDVAESDQPFGSLLESCKIKPVDDPSDPIAPARAEDGIYFLVVKHALQIRSTFLIRSREIPIPRSQSLSLHYLEPPFLPQDLEAGPHLRSGHMTRRAHNPDTISLPE